LLLVAEMLLVILRLCDNEAPEDANEEEDAKHKRKEALRAKVISVTRMMKMFSTLRYVTPSLFLPSSFHLQLSNSPSHPTRNRAISSEERETIMQLKALSDANNIPKGLLLGGRGAIQQGIILTSFSSTPHIIQL
jgi:hypothetical protein